MPKKTKIIIGSSILSVLIILGVLTAIFYHEVALSFVFKKQDYQSADRILSHSNISDERVLSLISKEGVVIDEQMAQVIAKNSIADKKRYRTLYFLSDKKGDSLLINRTHAVFSSLSSENIDWYAADILLYYLKNIDITDQDGVSLIAKSLNAAEKYKQEEVKEYFDTLFSKDISKLVSRETVQSMLLNTAISDEQCLAVIKKDNFPLNKEMAEVIAGNCIKSAVCNNVLKYISNKLAGDINIDGRNAIFKCLKAEKPNWTAATILLADLKDANILDNNNMCLLSRSIIAAGFIEDKAMNEYFDSLFKKDVEFRERDNNGNTPMHYVFKYANKPVMDKFFSYANQWFLESRATGDFSLCLNVKNNNGNFPWELIEADNAVGTVINCLIEANWNTIFIYMSDWLTGMNKKPGENKINVDECIKISDALSLQGFSYESNRDYKNAIMCDQYAVNYIDYSLFVAKQGIFNIDTALQASLEKKLEGLKDKLYKIVNQSIANSYQSSNKPISSNGYKDYSNNEGYDNFSSFQVGERVTYNYAGYGVVAGTIIKISGSIFVEWSTLIRNNKAYYVYRGNNNQYYYTDDFGNKKWMGNLHTQTFGKSQLSKVGY